MRRSHLFGIFGAIAALLAFAIAPLSAYAVERPDDLSIMTMKHLDVAWLGSYAALPSDEIMLQATIAEGQLLIVKDPPTLNDMLRTVAIRTKLDDTSRMRLDSG